MKPLQTRCLSPHTLYFFGQTDNSLLTLDLGLGPHWAVNDTLVAAVTQN
jgi:hypothetical protein